jgi:hypothetical protein
MPQLKQGTKRLRLIQPSESFCSPSVVFKLDMFSGCFFDFSLSAVPRLQRGSYMAKYGYNVIDNCSRKHAAGIKDEGDVLPEHSMHIAGNAMKSATNVQRNIIVNW